MSDENEILYGWYAIGLVLNMTARQAEYRLKAGKGPTFKVGRKIAARRVALRQWLTELEQAARDGASAA